MHVNKRPNEMIDMFFNKIIMVLHPKKEIVSNDSAMETLKLEVAKHVVWLFGNK